MSNFLTFLAHGERSLLEFLDIFDDKKYFWINQNDSNLYLTFSDIGDKLYDNTVNMIHYGLSDFKSRHTFKKKLEKILKMDPTDKLKFKSLQNLLKSVLFNGCIKNLFLLGEKEKKKNCETPIDITSSLDWDNILKPNVSYKPTEEIQKYFIKIINFYKIDDFIIMVRDNKKIPYDDPIFKILMFNKQDILEYDVLVLLPIYKFIILQICTMMQSSSHIKNDSLFFSILKYYPLDEIFIEDTLNDFHKELFNLIKNFANLYNLSLKLYYKEKPIPNYIYNITGYFADESSVITKIGLRKFTDHYYLINNYISDSNDIITKKIEPMKKRNNREEKIITDQSGRIFKYNSIIDDNNALGFLYDNYMFMTHGAMYPPRQSIDFIPEPFIDETGKRRLKFIKGNVRSLKELINEEQIFGTNNIVFLFSCADLELTDLETAHKDSIYDKSHTRISRARSQSIDWQNKRKYLKYKNKYLQLKKKL